MTSEETRKLSIVGLESVIRNGISRYYNDNPFCNNESGIIAMSIANNPNVIDHLFDEIDEYLKSMFYTACILSNIDLYNEQGGWKSRIESDSTPDDGGSIYEAYRMLMSRDSLVSVSSKLNPNFNWSKYFELLEGDIRVSRYVKEGWKFILGKYEEIDNSGFKSLLESLLFGGGSKINHDLRAWLYKVYISSGFLDKNSARRMRSDGSEWASSEAINSLIYNAEKYKNFDELALTFSDSRYEKVISIMARGLPPRLLPSIIGSASRFMNAQWSLNKRFTEIEEQKNAG